MAAGGSALYLIVEPGEIEDPALAARLAAALAEGGFQSALLRSAPGGGLPARVAKPLVELIAGKGCAALVADDAVLARTLRADGVHLTWSKDLEARYRDARDVLGERYIVGADAGKSRHEAMSLGEAGADYVAFGIPPHVEDRETARERQLGLVSWWSEIFEVPCVGFDAVDVEDAARLARAGADFVAIALPADLSATAAADWAKQLKSAVAGAEAAV